MNTVIHQSETSSLPYAREGECIVRQLSPQGEHDLSSKKQEAHIANFLQALKSRMQGIVPLFFLFVFVIVSAVMVYTDDIVKREGCKAMLIFLLLSQMKYLSQSLKKQ